MNRVPLNKLEALAVPAEVKPSANGKTHGLTLTAGGNHRLKVKDWLKDRGVKLLGERKLGDGSTAYDIPCPFNADHTGTDCAILQYSGGKLGAKCFHNSCAGRGWADFRDKIGKPEPHHYEPPLPPKLKATSTGAQGDRTPPPVPEPTPLSAMLKQYQELREPVIEGVARRGETVNVIAPSKTGKSWLVGDLVLAGPARRLWLGAFEVKADRVLVVDNELHPETSTYRMRKIADARGDDLDAIADCILFQNFRGALRDIDALESYFKQFERGQFDLVIIDTLYRSFPAGMSENDNAAVTAVYNRVDQYAEALNAAVVLIHHSSKGDQSGKTVTDVGAGAGAQSRAADAHLVLRSHEQEDVYVLEAAVRSWPPLKPQCLRWAFPLWHPVNDLDPGRLQRPEEKRKKAQKDAKEKEQDAELLSMLERLDPERQGYGKRQLQDKLGWHHEPMGRVLRRLFDAGLIEYCDVKYTSGKGANPPALACGAPAARRPKVPRRASERARKRVSRKTSREG